MTKYLGSFPDGAMTFPEADLPAVADAAHAVIQATKDAGCTCSAVAWTSP